MNARLLFSILLLNVILPNGATGQDQKPKKVLEWRSELIRALTFTSDGKYLVVSPKENDCWVFDAATGEKQTTDLKGLRGPTRLLAAGPRPDTVYCIEKIANRLVDIKTGKDIAVDGTAIDNTVMVGLSPKKDLLALGTYAGSVIVVKAEIGTWSSGTMIDEPPPQVAEHWPASAAAWAADNSLAASGRANGRLYLFKLKELRDESETAVAAHSGRIDALAFTPAGLWSLALDGHLKLWSTPDAKPLAAHSFSAQLDRGWLLCDGQIAAICRKPVAGEIEFHRLPQNATDKPELLGTIPIVGLFDGFPTVHREFTVPVVAVSPDWQQIALVAKSGSNDLAINQIAIYDVSKMFPKAPKSTEIAGNPSRTPSTPAKTKPPVVAPMLTEREFRVWKTADGAFSVEAQFVGKIGELVRLKRKDNEKVISVPLDKLSNGDQTYVRGLR